MSRSRQQAFPRASAQSGPVIVVGAGIGGLVSALELACAGREVLVLERALAPGGKMRRVTIDGTAMDAGPTVFTMRWVFEELFEAAGTRLAEHVRLRQAAVLARHAWADGSRLDLFADRQRSAEAIGDFAGAGAARGYLAFCERAARIYQSLEQVFLRDSRPSPASLLARAGLRGLPGLLQISPFTTLWSELGRYFTDPRLRQLFGRYATYCGASPWAAPATLMLVAHVEQSGVCLVDGGMHALARAVADLAAARGARFRYAARVDDILVRSGRACGVRLAGGEELAADAVVFNGDVAALSSGLLGARPRAAVVATDPRRRSLSAITWNLLASPRGFPLARHTVFFSNDYEAEFTDLFKRRRLPRAPTVYVCAQDRNDDGTLAPVAEERLLLIVNAPATGDRGPIAPEELTRCDTETFQHLSRCGLRLLRQPDRTLVTTPSDFERLFPATGGALYGQAPHGWAASFSRPGARSALPGLYLAGGSVHPGPGVPMAALSGRQAAASVLADAATTTRAGHASTARSGRTAMPGGTSTP